MVGPLLIGKRRTGRTDLECDVRKSAPGQCRWASPFQSPAHGLRSASEDVDFWNTVGIPRQSQEQPQLVVGFTCRSYRFWARIPRNRKLRMLTSFGRECAPHPSRVALPRRLLLHKIVEMSVIYLDEPLLFIRVVTIFVEIICNAATGGFVRTRYVRI